MNKSLIYVNLNLELHVVSTFWLGSDTSGTFSLHFVQPSFELEIPALKRLEDAHNIRWCRIDICSSKLSAKYSLILDNPLLVPSLCKLKHISVCFIQISTKSPANSLIPFRGGNVFFEAIPCLGPLGKFQHNIKTSIKTARVSRLSVSCDYGPYRNCGSDPEKLVKNNFTSWSTLMHFLPSGI